MASEVALAAVVVSDHASVPGALRPNSRIFGAIGGYDRDPQNDLCTTTVWQKAHIAMSD